MEKAFRAKEALQKLRTKIQNSKAILQKEDYLQLIKEIEEYQNSLALQNSQNLKTTLEEPIEKNQGKIVTLINPELFFNIYAQAPYAIEVYDRDGCLINANNECLKLFGVEELTHIKKFKLFNDPNLPENALNKIKNGIAINFETEFDFDLVKTNKLYPTKKSGKLYLNIFIKPFINHNKSVEGYLVHIINLTKYKALENDRNTQQIILQQIIDNIPIMITYFDENGKIKMINNEVVKNLGWNFNEWQSNNIFAKCYPDPDYLKEMLDFMISKPKGWKDCKTTTKFGTVLETTWTNVVLANGISLGIGKDITERKKNENNIIDANIKWETTFNGIKDAVFLINSTGLIVEANKASLEIVKKKKEDIIGTPCHEVIASTHHNYENWPLVKTQKSKKRETIVLPIADKWLEITVDPILDKRSQMIGAVCIISNITERKIIEQAIKQSEEKLRTVFNVMQEGMALNEFVFNTEGEIIDYKIIEINNAFEKITALNREQIVGRNATEIYGINHEYINSFWKQHINDKQAIKTVLYDARNKTWNSISTSIPVQNKFTTVFTDITEKKLAEEKLAIHYSILNSIIESTNDLIFSLDKKYRYTSFNKNHAAIMKAIYNVEIELGKSILDYMWITEDRKKAKKNIDKALTGESLIDEAFSGDEEHKRLYFEVKHNPILNKGNIIGVAVKSEEITERKKAEDELKKNRSELQEYFENDISADYLVSVEGEIFSCNKTFLNMFGFESKKHTEKFNITELYKNPNSRKELIRRIKIEGKVENFEVDFVTRKNTVLNVMLNAVGIFDHQGRLVQTRGYVVDITDRKQAEKSLKLFRALIDRTNDAIEVIDPENGRFLDVNEKGCSALGYTREEFLKLSVFDIDPKVELTTFREIVEEVKGLDHKVWKGIHLRKNGTTFPVEVTIKIVNLDKAYIVSIARDITERLKTEETLLKLKYAVEQSPVSIVITDKNGTIEYSNQKVTEITGYSLNELIGKNPRIFNSGEKSRTEYKELWTNISSGKEWFGEFHNKKKNGELYWENASISPIVNEMGVITHFIAVKEDITERKITENELIRAKAKAEESDKLKTAFLANMSHEIRTPMNAILGFSQLLLNDKLKAYEKKIFTNYIRTNGESLVKIIDDIIDISKIQSKQLTITMRDFDLHLLIKELDIYYSKIMVQKSKNFIKLRTQIPNLITDAFFIHSDESRLKQILNNLITNAIKYTKEGHIEFGYKVDGTNIHFFVRDTGVGISVENQNQIFERFVQYSDEYISRQEGTGLGLAISKDLVAFLGGELKVISEKGKGSVFYFELPYVKINSKTQIKNIKSKKITDYNLSEKNILIVDDEESNFVLLKRVLSKTKIKIDWAENGEVALKKIAENKYNLIIMDIKMPIMDGIEATRKIKAYNKNIPVIIQTAYALDETKQRCIQAGCDDFILKPISIEGFFALVTKFILKTEKRD